MSPDFVPKPHHERVSKTMHKVLFFLRNIGLLAEVPRQAPSPKTVLARGVCFLHDGADNPNAFLLYHDGYACMTIGCHKDKRFGNNLEGLIRHMVYRTTGAVMSWQEAWRFARSNAHRLKQLIDAANVRHADVAVCRPQISWTKDQLLNSLKVPCPYFLGRDFKPETLSHFGIGTCVRQLPDGNARLLGWSIIPVLHRPDLPPVGYTCRNPQYGNGGGQTIKWMHRVKRSEVLYNWWNAGLYSTPLIITEGVPNVLRLHEAGMTGAVATLGSSLSDTQFHLVVCLLRRQKVYIAADNDDAGRKFAEQVRQRLQGVCDPLIILPPSGRKDFGDCSTNEVRDFFTLLKR